jgi:hypothetical protein
MYYQLKPQQTIPREGNNIYVKKGTNRHPLAHALAKRIERIFTAQSDHIKK